MFAAKLLYIYLLFVALSACGIFLLIYLSFAALFAWLVSFLGVCDWFIDQNFQSRSTCERIDKHLWLWWKLCYDRRIEPAIILCAPSPIAEWLMIDRSVCKFRFERFRMELYDAHRHDLTCWPAVAWFSLHPPMTDSFARGQRQSIHTNTGCTVNLIELSKVTPSFIIVKNVWYFVRYHKFSSRNLISNADRGRCTVYRTGAQRTKSVGK